MRLVADANVILLALIGGRAQTVLAHPAVSEILTTEFTIGEVCEYVERLAAKKKLELTVVLLTMSILPVKIVPRENYEHCLPEARKRIGGRDPDDIDLLALALSSEAVIWSNDNDFAEGGVDWLTTAQLLKRLEH